MNFSLQPSLRPPPVRFLLGQERGHHQVQPHEAGTERRVALYFHGGIVHFQFAPSCVVTAGRTARTKRPKKRKKESLSGRPPAGEGVRHVQPGPRRGPQRRRPLIPDGRTESVKARSISRARICNALIVIISDFDDELKTRLFCTVRIVAVDLIK